MSSPSIKETKSKKPADTLRLITQRHTGKRMEGVFPGLYSASVNLCEPMPLLLERMPLFLTAERVGRKIPVPVFASTCEMSQLHEAPLQADLSCQFETSKRQKEDQLGKTAADRKAKQERSHSVNLG